MVHWHGEHAQIGGVATGAEQHGRWIKLRRARERRSRRQSLVPQRDPGVDHTSGT